VPATSLARLVALAALWGGAFLFMRIVAPAIGAPLTAFARVSLGAIGLVLLMAAMRAPWSFAGRFPATLALGAINSGIPFLMFAIAARVLPAGYSAILNATAPLMGVALGALFFGERLTAPRIAGVTVGLAGVAVLTGAGPVAFDVRVLAGVAACLVATTCYGLAGYLTRRWITDRGGLDSRLVALGSQIGAALLLLPVVAWHGASVVTTVAGMGSGVWIALALLGFFCTSLAYILYFRLIADVGPVTALTVTLLIPAFAVLWGWLFLGEQGSWAHLAGGGLIALSLGLVLRQNPAG
jgi:drug/metabolite transporter (DMT)-like permease